MSPSADSDCLFVALEKFNGRVQELGLSMVTAACRTQVDTLGEFMTDRRIRTVMMFAKSSNLTVARYVGEILLRCSYIGSCIAVSACSSRNGGLRVHAEGRREVLKSSLESLVEVMLTSSDSAIKHWIAGVIVNCSLNGSLRVQAVHIHRVH